MGIPLTPFRKGRPAKGRAPKSGGSHRVYSVINKAGKIGSRAKTKVEPDALKKVLDGRHVGLADVEVLLTYLHTTDAKVVVDDGTGATKSLTAYFDEGGKRNYKLNFVVIGVGDPRKTRLPAVPTLLVENIPKDSDNVEFYNALGPWASADVVTGHLGQLSRTTMANLRKRRQILGVQFGFRNEFYYPVQQFDGRGIIGGWDKVLKELSAFSPIEIATMMANPIYADSDLTFWGALQLGKIDDLVDWARRTNSRLVAA